MAAFDASCCPPAEAVSAAPMPPGDSASRQNTTKVIPTTVGTMKRMRLMM
jgi:hypothetical protein